MKKLTTAEKNLIASFIPNWDKLDSENKSIEVSNRFGFGTCLVSPLVFELSQITFTLLSIYEHGNLYRASIEFPGLNIKSMAKVIQLFDRTKYLICKLDQKAYSILID